MKPTLKDIEAFISDIPDPEIPVITIKELGILRNVEYDNSSYVITITPTYTACPAMALIEQQVKENLEKHGIKNVVIKLTYSPAWTTDWMSEETKRKLKDYGIVPPQHSTCAKAVNQGVNIKCPRCNSANTQAISYFGSTACKALYQCADCKEPFEYFKCH